MKKMLLSLWLVFVIAGFITGCASSSEPSEAYRNESPQEIYERGRAALQDKSYNEAVKRFEALDVQYPFGKETENAQLYLIYAYYMQEEYALSSSAANRFIRLHPANPHIDYAYYMRGIADYYQNMGVLEKIFTIDLAKRDLTQIQKSFDDFSQLTERYPNSRYTPAANQYMIYLRNVIAAHILQVAQYYYDHKAYVAAINRASDVVAHYEGAPSTVDALILMVKAYHQLGLTKEEQDALRVLQYNYPDKKIDMNS